jgi:L-ascorbate metabolism protein UlaG (beta-lactamase superfamily)
MILPLITLLLCIFWFLHGLGWLRIIAAGRFQWECRKRFPQENGFQPKALNPTTPIDPETPTLLWLGHSCFLLYLQGQTLLFDPVFSGAVSKIARRMLAIPHVGELPRLDQILVSHGHMDHLDPKTLLCFRETPILMPRKTEQLIPKSIRNQLTIHTIDSNETHTCGAIEIIPVPARHGGWRYPHQRGYKAFGYILRSNEQCVYFAGDTAFGPHFKMIGDTYKPEIAILPIGAYAPRFFLKSRHMNPAEAIEAAEILGVKKIVPCHFGTYRVANDTPWEAITDFTRRMRSKTHSFLWELPFWAGL